MSKPQLSNCLPTSVESTWPFQPMGSGDRQSKGCIVRSPMQKLIFLKEDLMNIYEFTSSNFDSKGHTLLLDDAKCIWAQILQGTKMSLKVNKCEVYLYGGLVGGKYNFSKYTSFSL